MTASHADDFGERFEEAAVRELAEETGLEADADGVRIGTILVDGTRGVTRVTAAALVAAASGTAEVREPEEIAGWEWWPLDALPGAAVRAVGGRARQLAACAGPAGRRVPRLLRRHGPTTRLTPSAPPALSRPPPCDARFWMAVPPSGQDPACRSAPQRGSRCPERPCLPRQSLAGGTSG
ncbi:NUDIX hydrolase [Streptomyces sp. ISL-10]|uniref:NUDIX hydrolase n=1 Tax=Streptomyces sp. ISL-10 TaxID=2819172 RepID=UPI0027E58224|nr:NUDIX hydrolase [Streptomyces sp. ISL-10]